MLLDLVRAASKANYQVLIVCFRDGPIGDILRQEGFKVETLGETTLDLPAFFKLRSIISEFKPDLIHSHLFRATFWARMAVLFKKPLKLITSIHGSETDCYHYLEKLFSFRTERFIFPSRFLKNWYDQNIKKLPAEKSEIIFPGVTITLPPENSAESDKRVKIGTLSRLHKVKGLDILLDACAELLKSNQEFEIHIAGDGRQKKDLQLQAQRLGLEKNCFFHGEISSKLDYLSDLSFFVAPSRQEAFGINICEAMERGLAVAASNVGGIPEIVEHEKTGLLFNPDDRQSIVNALKRLINNKALRQSAGLNARVKVEQNFDRKNAIIRHMEIFRNHTERLNSVHFAISSSELGGGERVALGIISALKERGWKISATCVGNPLAEKLRETGINVSCSNMRAGGLFFALRLFLDLLHNKPALISSHLNKASLWSGIAGKATGISSISHVHGLNRRSYYQFSDCLIAVSQAVADHLLSQKLNPEKIHIIPNRINNAAKNSRRLSDKDAIVIAITAKLHRNKGHQWALETIARELKRLPECRLIVIGDGPERQSLENLCKKLHIEERVKFTGFVDNPEIFYDEVDLMLLPSLGEGIPLSLLEAMRWGLPCIASNIGGIPEIITDGFNGILVEPENSEQLIEAINKVCKPQNYEFYSKNAVNAFSRLNDYQAMIEEIERVFSAAINKK